jgi:hypothetical protein
MAQLATLTAALQVRWYGALRLQQQLSLLLHHPRHTREVTALLVAPPSHQQQARAAWQQLWLRMRPPTHPLCQQRQRRPGSCLDLTAQEGEEPRPPLQRLCAAYDR